MIDGIYYAHQPIYGYRSNYSSGSDISRYMLTKSILNTINNYSFKTFIDIGGAEGYTANLVRKIFKADVMSTDLSVSACHRAKEIFNIEAVPCDIHSLPFKDNMFDIVLCSETLEHVTNYKQAIKELLRITKHVLIITVPHESPELVEENIKEKVPHGHINAFDIHTLDYLKNEGYSIKYEKTLSPYLVIPRIVIEGRKKEKPGILTFLYNSITPLLRVVFREKTAVRISNADKWFSKKFGKYGGITYAVEKNNAIIKNALIKTISTQDFIDEKVKPYKLSEQQPR
jgi:ubiquinone/menaquinone biosynthesis C-methylase UbiE